MLTDIESQQLASLLDKAEWPLPQNVFYAFVKKAITVPIELAVFNEKGEILLVYRDDVEFTGWHMFGTVIRDSDTLLTAMDRLIMKEVVVKVTKPKALGYLECLRDSNSPRHAMALLFACQLLEDYTGPARFFEPENLPFDTLSHHQRMIPIIRQRANEQ